MVKNQPASAIPGWEDPLENEIATHSSILAWKTAGTEDPGVQARAMILNFLVTTCR